ncbi:putative Transient receptor potential cation channel subfamily M member 3 [Hypsibius exemplaris]|uniref:Transient receptor potential cation channel subfamily M member 3 n=1 Tax=Hypsibius exemplaris TaxID=2072580 RepID=A0A9X6N9V7_HYPEX|nr:putative Transient receptor potential cation channel subfamily M member 3 [Hypsibius exemplaris]
MDALCGKVHFNTTDQYAPNIDRLCNPPEERRYIRVNYDVSLESLAQFMVTTWNLGSPDIMISMISGVHQSKAWKKAEHRSALQKGIVKLANTSQTWIFTHGLNYGLAKLIGDAVREDQDRQSVRGNWDHIAQSAYNQRVTQPRLIGVVPDALLNNPDQYLQGHGKVDINVTDEYERPRPKYEMNPNHDVFVLVNNTSYTATAVFRGQLERSLQAAASARKETVRTANLQLLKPDDDVYEQSGVMEPPETSQKPNYAIPMVCILIQGGPAEIDQVLYYLNDNVPVIVIKGTGLMADLLAFAYEEIMERGGLDIELDHIKPEIENKMIRYFPAEFKDNEPERIAYLLKILGCVRVSHKQDRKYIMIFDLALSDSDLADLDWYILKALFACQSQFAIHKRDIIRKNLILTVMWNRPDLAKSEIFQRDFSAADLRIDRDIFEQALLKRDREAFVDMFLQQGFQLNTFVTASQLRTLFAKVEDREFFVTVVWESLLEKSPASPIKDKFIDIKLNEIVEHLTGIRNFVRIKELSQDSQRNLIVDHLNSERKASNALIVWAVLMNRLELARVLWKFSEHPIPLALFISSLYKNLSRFAPSSEVEKKTNESGVMFGSLAVDVLHLSYQDATNRAFEVLGEPFEDFENMTPMELSYRVGNKHFIAHPCSQRYLNEVFNGGIRIVKGPGSFYIPDFLKLVLSACLVFPMYFWVSFPRLEANARNSREKQKGILAGTYPVTAEGNMCPFPAMLIPSDKNVIPLAAEMVQLVHKSSGVTGLSQNANSTLYVSDPSKEDPYVAIIQTVTSDMGDKSLRRLRKSSHYPGAIQWNSCWNRLKLCCFPKKRLLADNPLTEVTTVRKLVCLWNAPITKFWMYQLNYWCFLAVFSVATFLPGCGEFGLDLALWVWTWLNLLEFVCRRHHALLKKLTVSDLLQSAAENNVPRLAQYIALGFDLNSADMFGWTALMCASQRGSFDAVRCLITSGGVDFTRRNTKNQSAADLAAISRQSAIASYLCELENYELFDVKLPLKEVEKDEEVVTQPFFCSVCGVTFERTTEEEHRTSILHQLHTGFAPGKTASYGLPESNVGFRLMRQSGWDSEKGLGAAENGRRYPIATVFKRDRLGLGRAGKESPRVTHYPHQLEREGKVKPADGAATKRDITARTYFEYGRRRMMSIGWRLVEMLLIAAFLLAFLFSRLLSQWAPARFTLELYETKILMCVAMLFFYYRLVFTFFPISRKLGPMLEKIKLMTSVDFVVFLKMVLPFMIASAVAMQASLYPDYPIGWENIRMTFHRAFFALFLTPASDLQVENFGRCEQQTILFGGKDAPSRPGVCWAGTNSKHDCPVVGFSSYSIVIQYSIILKMILVTLLSAMFYNTYSGIDREADSIWKYQRYQLVLDFSTRPTFAGPLSLVAYSSRFCVKYYKALQLILRKALGKNIEKPPRIYPRKGEFFKYWKAMVREHCRNTDLALKNANLAKEQFKKIQGMDEELNRHRSNWYRLRERIIAMEKNIEVMKRAIIKEPPSEVVKDPTPSAVKAEEDPSAVKAEEGPAEPVKSPAADA